MTEDELVGVALTDEDTGQFEVYTETAIYLLDLEGRRLRRFPRYPDPAAGDPPLRAGVLVHHFDELDGAWVPLARLVFCEFGAPLRAVAVLDGQHQPWRSTLVRSIRRR